MKIRSVQGQLPALHHLRWPIKAPYHLHFCRAHSLRARILITNHANESTSPTSREHNMRTTLIPQRRATARNTRSLPMLYVPNRNSVRDLWRTRTVLSQYRTQRLFTMLRNVLLTPALQFLPRSPSTVLYCGKYECFWNSRTKNTIASNLIDNRVHSILLRRQSISRVAIRCVKINGRKPTTCTHLCLQEGFERRIIQHRGSEAEVASVQQSLPSDGIFD